MKKTIPILLFGLLVFSSNCVLGQTQLGDQNEVYIKPYCSANELTEMEHFQIESSKKFNSKLAEIINENPSFKAKLDELYTIDCNIKVAGELEKAILSNEYAAIKNEVKELISKF